MSLLFIIKYTKAYMDDINTYSISSIINDRPSKQWMDSERIRLLMRSASYSEFLSFVAICLVFAILYGQVDLLHLSLWTAVGSALLLVRLRNIKSYHENKTHSREEQIRLYDKQHIGWPLSAVLWGSLGFLFFERVPQENQFLCFLILAGVGFFSVHNLSPHPRAYKHFAIAFIVALLLSVFWIIGTRYEFYITPRHLVYIVMLFLYGYLLLLTGKRLFITHRENLNLHQQNSKLIESLRFETCSLQKEKAIALEAIEVRKRFIASAAHDIRQPVVALGLFANWLKDEPQLIETISPKILESTKAMNNLFESLLEFDRIDSGQIKTEFMAIDIAGMLTEIVNINSLVATKKGVQLSVKSLNEKVFSDRLILKRILGNFIHNAIKCTLPGGRILLAARVLKDSISFEVWDTGVGIAPEHQTKIYAEFYKIVSHTGQEVGFGLGLPIVKRLADLLPGARLEMKSKLGRGSVFKLIMPRTQY
jgi:signal transduction histidine kinase